MVRTVLRSRSGDYVSAVQLADRTGIVAASAPPVEPDDPTESLPSVLFAMPEPPSQRRRGRRNVLFACAAALFLLVGWVGGGMFGHDDPGPAVASSPLADQVQPGPQDADVPPPPSAPAPPPAAAPQPAPAQAVAKAATSTKRATPRKQSAAPAAPATPDTQPAQPRNEPVAGSSGQDQADDTMSAQFRQMLDLWTRANAQYRGNNNNGNSNAWGAAYGR